MKKKMGRDPGGTLGDETIVRQLGGPGSAEARCNPGSERVTWQRSRPVISFSYLTGADPDNTGSVPNIGMKVTFLG